MLIGRDMDEQLWHFEAAALHRRQMKQLKAGSFLSKPVQEDELVKTLRDILLVA